MANLLLFLAFTFLLALQVRAEVSLKTAADFTILAGSSIANTGPTIITGDIGVYPGTSVVGFPPGVYTGTVHHADDAAQIAQTDAMAAFDAITSLRADVDLTGQDLGSMWLTPGIYQFAAGATITGDVTLDAEGSPEAQWIFKIGSTLITSVESTVTVINGGQFCNIYWQVGSSATLGVGSLFYGNILALISITANTAVEMTGGLYALTGAVTIDSVKIEPAVCIPDTTSPITTSVTTTSTSTPTSTSGSTSPSTSSSPSSTSSTPPSTSSTPPSTSSTSPSTSPTSALTSPTSTSSSSASMSGSTSPFAPSLTTSTSSLSTSASISISNSSTQSTSTSGTSAILTTSPLPGNHTSRGISYSGGYGGTGSSTIHQTTSTGTAPSHASHASYAIHPYNYPNSTFAGRPASTTAVESLIYITVSCSTAPTTITTYGQTFTLTETGITSIICPSSTPKPVSVDFPAASIVTPVIVIPGTQVLSGSTGTMPGNSMSASTPFESSNSEAGSKFASASTVPTFSAYTGSGWRTSLSRSLAGLAGILLTALVI